MITTTTHTPVGMVAGGLPGGAIRVRTMLTLGGVLPALCALALLLPGARDAEAPPKPGYTQSDTAGNFESTDQRGDAANRVRLPLGS